MNGTIRALDEMMAAENIPLADCLGTSFVPTSEAPLATLPGLQIPSSATLPGLPDPMVSPQGLSNALTRDAPPSRRLADAEDTAHVASLLCSPDSPQPLQDLWEPGPSSKVSPKPPDSQQLFQVVPVEVGEAQEAPVEPPVASEAPPLESTAIGSSQKLVMEGPWTQNLMDVSNVQHRNGEQSGEGHLGHRNGHLGHLASPLPPLEDAIESFSEDLVLQSQDAIQATEPMLVPQELQPDHRNADQFGPPNSKNLQDTQTAMVQAESTRKNLDSAFYRNVIDVTDDHLSQTAVTSGFVPAQAMAMVPHSQKAQVNRAPRRVPLTDAVGRPLKRRRPALLSQHLRSHGLTQQMTASQRLCVSLARRRQSRQGKAWILSQAAQASTQKSSRKMSDHPDHQTAKVAVSQGKSPERPNVLFTGFSRSDLHQLKQSVNCLGGSAVRDLPTGRSAAETRVVVRCTVSEGRQIAGARTIKYLDAVLAGAWVLSPDWVHESMRAGHWLAEGKFELQGDTAKMGGPSRGRQHGPELFAGFRFHFVAQVRKPKKDCEEAEGPAPHELVRFARRAGAEVVDTLRKLPDAKEDPPHLADELLSSKRKRKRSSNSTKETSGFPNLWWRKPIMVTVPSKATKGRGSERTTRLAEELGWVILPSSWMLDCISCGEVCLPTDEKG